jgi:hypothetical protein
MIHLQNPWFHLRIKHHIKTQHFEAHRVVEIIGLA